MQRSRRSSSLRLSAVACCAAALVLAGCAGTVAGTASPGTSSSSSPGSPATGSGPSTSGPTGSGPVTSEPSTSGPSTGGPSTSGPTGTARPPGDGPSADATELLKVTTVPTYYCPIRGTSTPWLVVYSDGWILRASGIGAWCNELPTVQSGWLDPGQITARIDTYLASPEAGVDMRLLDVTDLPMSTVALAGTGRTARISVYGLGFGDYIPDEQRAARAALDALLDGFGDVAAEPWTVDRLSVVSAREADQQQTSIATWPSSSADQIAGLVDPDDTRRRCVEITDAADAGRIITAHGPRSAAATWQVSGTKAQLAIGIVLPGQQACQGV